MFINYQMLFYYLEAPLLVFLALALQPGITNNSIKPSNVLLYRTHLRQLHKTLPMNIYSLPGRCINPLLQDYYEYIPSSV
jgi:hypothetical protein